MELISYGVLTRASSNCSFQEPQDQTANKSSSEEESSEEEEGVDPDKPAMTREQRRAAAKAKKEAAIARKSKQVAKPGDLPSSEEEDEEDSDSDDAPANPNHTAKSRSQASAAPRIPDSNAASKPGAKASSSGAQLSRREREALQAQQAKERYQKLHAEGKTDEARADLARLSLIRERREVEAARKKAEKEEKEEAEKERAKELEKERAKRNAAMNVGSSKPGAKKKA